MDEKKIWTYSWGPLYETLQEMIKNGDELPDEGLKKGFKLFHRLDEAKSLVEIDNILKEFSLNRTEQLRLNSPCLDGIIECMQSQEPFYHAVVAVRNSDTYIYFNRKFNGKFRSLMHTVGRTDLIEYILSTESEEDLIHLFTNYFEEACTFGHEDIIKLWINHKATQEFPKIVYTKGLHEVLRSHMQSIREGYITQKLLVIIKMLIDVGAEFDYKYENEFVQNLCKYNHVDFLKYLFDKGVEKPTLDITQYSPEIQALFLQN